jgi:hypothetical protein
MWENEDQYVHDLYVIALSIIQRRSFIWQIAFSHMRFLVPVVFLAVILFALLAMKTLPNEPVRTLPNESVSPQTYLFIETQKHKNGTIINGTPSSLFIDAPTYDLRNSTLRTVERIELNSSTKAIYGNKFQISGDIGSGISSRLYPIRYLPYNYGEINILKIEG